MKASFSDTVLAKTGKLYVQWRFGTGEQARRELHQRYEGEYRNAGLVLLFDLLMALGVVAIACLLTAIIYGLFF